MQLPEKAFFYRTFFKKFLFVNLVKNVKLQKKAANFEEKMETRVILQKKTIKNIYFTFYFCQKIFKHFLFCSTMLFKK